MRIRDLRIELVGVRVRVKLGWMFMGRGVRVSI